MFQSKFKDETDFRVSKGRLVLRADRYQVIPAEVSVVVLEEELGSAEDGSGSEQQLIHSRSRALQPDAGLAALSC